MHHHPWRELRALTGVALHLAHLRPGVHAVTDGHSRIWVDSRLSQVERRSALAHELEHLHRGHRGCQPEPVERVVESAAARRLIPNVHRLADALVCAGHDLHVAAEELWVDVRTLRARLDPAHLHPAERAILTARMEEASTWH